MNTILYLHYCIRAVLGISELQVTKLPYNNNLIKE